MPRTEIRIYDLLTLFKKIEKGELLIPSFQRGFVWRKKEIVDLLESVYEGFPIGTLLFLQSSEKFFKSSEFTPRSKRQSSSSNKDYFLEVIDGFQRLNALYNCLYVEDDNKDPVFKIGFDLSNKQFTSFKPNNSNINVIELSSIFSSERYIDIQIRLSKGEESELLLNEMNHLYSVFKEYQVPVIMLTNANLEDVIEIFQRLNTRGSALSKDDVIRAMNQMPKKTGLE
jgi:uncharacterized protein with ParB-like and HNH nuclease domain